jgi:hypothetical protein
MTTRVRYVGGPANGKERPANETDTYLAVEASSEAVYLLSEYGRDEQGRILIYTWRTTPSSPTFPATAAFFQMLRTRRC